MEIHLPCARVENRIVCPIPKEFWAVVRTTDPDLKKDSIDLVLFDDAKAKEDFKRYIADYRPKGAYLDYPRKGKTITLLAER